MELQKKTGIKSQCCNAEIEEIKASAGLFSLTTGALICTACRKFCFKKSRNEEKQNGKTVSA